MKILIHRGTQEIGGSCVELWTDTTRIVLDIGMPLVEKDGSEFDFRKYQHLTINELISRKILPEINWFHNHSGKLINGVLISHPHIDHYGFSHFLHPDIHFYLGKATHKLIALTGIFTPQRNVLKNYTYFEKSKPFMIGDMRITPFWMDHSGFDAYAFFIEAEGKALFYSGDFRGNGRKKAFQWFKHNAPAKTDCLLMEGTQIERNAQKNKSETEIENELYTIFSSGDKINLVYTSGQNIDRLVSIYKACKRAKKTFVIDVYIATILKKLSRFVTLPYPSENFKDVKVIFSYFICKHLTNNHQEKLLYQFRQQKITKEEIGQNQKDIVMAVRPSMKFDLKNIQNLDGGTLIYSLWEGYLKKENTKKFIDYLRNKNFKVFKVHTSGHADIATLKEMANIIKPKRIIPIHTFRGNLYKQFFDYPVLEVKDGEEVTI